MFIIKSPTIITQNQPNEEDILWDLRNNSVIDKQSYATTVKPLYNISGINAQQYRSYTSQIWTTGYDFSEVGNDIVGVELRLNCMRLARVQDYLIQLCLNGNLIGENVADITKSDEAIYSGDSDFWGVNLTSAKIKNQTFGIVIQQQSNLTIPHRDQGYIDQIMLGVYFE